MDAEIDFFEDDGVTRYMAVPVAARTGVPLARMDFPNGLRIETSSNTNDLSAVVIGRIV